MTKKEQKVNTALWRIGMVKGAQAVEKFIRQGVDLTDEVKNLSDISKDAYLAQWSRARYDANAIFPSFKEELEDMYEKVFDKCIPF